MDVTALLSHWQLTGFSLYFQAYFTSLDGFFCSFRRMWDTPSVTDSISHLLFLRNMDY